MTRRDHPTGTDRLAEVAAAMPDYGIIVNVQGDEPLIAPALIDALVSAFDGDETLAMATVKTRIDDEEEQVNPNNVKVVTDKDGYALYFSRSLLPYPRHHLGIPVYKHIGIYAYRRDFREAVRPRRMIAARHDGLASVRKDNGLDALVVRRDDRRRRAPRLFRAVVDATDHRLPGDVLERLAREARRCVACRYDTKGFLFHVHPSFSARAVGASSPRAAASFFSSSAWNAA